MNERCIIELKNRAAGLILILLPLLMAIGFASHPQFFDFNNPWKQGVDVFIKEFHGNPLWWHAHLTVLLLSPLWIVLVMALSSLLRQKSERLALVGLVTGVYGAVMLAADKGIWALALSAIEALPEEQFVAAVPVINQLYTKAGFVWVADLFYLVIVAITVIAVGLIRTKILPTWQGAALLLGSFFFYNPDIDALNFAGSVFFLVALAPLGISLIRGDKRVFR